MACHLEGREAQFLKSAMSFSLFRRTSHPILWLMAKLNVFYSLHCGFAPSCIIKVEFLDVKVNARLCKTDPV